MCSVWASAIALSLPPKPFRPDSPSFQFLSSPKPAANAPVLRRWFSLQAGCQRVSSHTLHAGQRPAELICFVARRQTSNGIQGHFISLMPRPLAASLAKCIISPLIRSEGIRKVCIIIYLFPYEEALALHQAPASEIVVS